MEKELKFRGGLCELPEDLNDFPLGAVFGVEKDLPKEFLVSGADKLKVKNQGNSDLCSAYVVCSCSELQEKVELNPEYQFAFSKLISGDIEAWGQNLRDACKTPVKYGSLEQEDFDDYFNNESKGMYEALRDTSYWGDYNSNFIFEQLSEPHKKQSYFRADLGIGNKMDLLKSAMYKHNSAIVSGINWKYTNCKNGIIEPNDYQGMGHAITIIGWTVIKDYEYLIIHNSIGTEFGLNGLWYLPRDMVDELRFGNYIFIDLPREEAEFMLKNNIQITDNWLVKLYKIIINFLKKI